MNINACSFPDADLGIEATEGSMGTRQTGPRSHGNKPHTVFFDNIYTIVPRDDVKCSAL